MKTMNKSTCKEQDEVIIRRELTQWRAFLEENWAVLVTLLILMA